MCGGFFGFSRLVEALELVDVAAVVRDRDARALAGVVGGAAADGDEAVALVLLVERHRVHDVVVLGVGLDLVVDHDLEPVVLHRLDDLVDDVGAAQARRHHQRLLEAQLQGLRADHLVRAGAQHGPGERVELLDRERLEQLLDLHGSPFGNRNVLEVPTRHRSVVRERPSAPSGLLIGNVCSDFTLSSLAAERRPPPSRSMARESGPTGCAGCDVGGMIGVTESITDLDLLPVPPSATDAASAARGALESDQPTPTGCADGTSPRSPYTRTPFT